MEVYQLSKLPKELLIKIIVEQNLPTYFSTLRQCNEQARLAKEKSIEILKEKEKIIDDRLQDLVPKKIIDNLQNYVFEKITLEFCEPAGENIKLSLSYINILPNRIKKLLSIIVMTDIMTWSILI